MEAEADARKQESSRYLVDAVCPPRDKRVWHPQRAPFYPFLKKLFSKRTFLTDACLPDPQKLLTLPSLCSGKSETLPFLFHIFFQKYLSPSSDMFVIIPQYVIYYFISFIKSANGPRELLTYPPSLCHAYSSFERSTNRLRCSIIP